MTEIPQELDPLRIAFFVVCVVAVVIAVIAIFQPEDEP
jgi:hypothetical protein